MEIDNKIKSSLSFVNNLTTISNETYKQLLENCFSVLSTKTEPHNSATLLGSKPDIIKEVYAAMLKLTLEFARHDLTEDIVYEMLKNEYNIEQQRAVQYKEYYGKNKLKVQIILGNIGNHLPHIVDVKWKIDYIIKSNNLDRFEGPIFRITLITEQYEDSTSGKGQKEINFSCDSSELQDLVYKLKDVVRHCQKLSVER